MRFVQATLLTLAMLGLAPAAGATTYYIDFDGGDNHNSGQSPDEPWRHSAGDGQADGHPAEVELEPGDRLLFKGGVRYRGIVQVGWSGEPGRPIVLDGNSEGTFGDGPAIIEGGEAVTDWRRVESIEQAQGNPHWQRIFVTTIEPADSWLEVNLTDEQGPLPIAQWPAASDAMFYTNTDDYHRTDEQIDVVMPFTLTPRFGAHVNRARPLINAVTDSGSAVVSPVVGSGFEVAVDEPITVSRVGIRMLASYTQLKDVEIYGDDELLATLTLVDGERDMQTVTLDEPATVRAITYKFISAHGEVEQDWTAIGRVAAYHEDDTNLLAASPYNTLLDPDNLTADDPDHYNDMHVVFHGGANTVINRPVRGFDPDAGRLEFDYYGGNLYSQTRYALMNSVKLIDTPGEYATAPAEDGRWKLYFMPRAGEQPSDIYRSSRRIGMAVRNVDHITIQGFRIRNQGGSRAAGIDMAGANHVRIRDVEVTGVSGSAGIAAVNVHQVRIERVHSHHNPGRTRGVLLRNSTHCELLDSRLDRNTLTGMNYYNVQHGRVAGNVVSGHRGVHANGLTFYLGCEDIVIEGNTVYDGNNALTIQAATDVIIRNNVFDGDGDSMPVGIWTATPLENVRFYHNAMIRGVPGSDWQVGLFSNNRGPGDLVVKNNIIDGRSGNLPGEFSHNLYTRAMDEDELGTGELVVAGLADIMIDPGNRDYRLRPGSPAINAGVPLDEVDTDAAGTSRPQGEAPDIGPYEHR